MTSSVMAWVPQAVADDLVAQGIALLDRNSDVIYLGDAYLSRVSPARDGTVAVEDVERLVEALRRYGAHEHGCQRRKWIGSYPAGGGCTCGLEEALAL